MPKDNTGVYRVKTFKELIRDLSEILDNVHPFDYKGNPTDDPTVHADAITNLRKLYIDFPHLEHKVPLFDEIDAVNLIVLKLQSLTSEQEPYLGNDEGKVVENVMAQNLRHNGKSEDF